MNTQNKTKAILILAIVAMAVFAGTAMAALPEPSGINPQTGVIWANGDLYRLAFVTSSNPDGATDPNILHYNEVVQNLADAAGLDEAIWYCIGSTSALDAAGAIDARDNTMTNPEDPNDPNCPIFLVDGVTLVASSNLDLWDGEIAHIIDQDESGGAGYPHLWAFTGTYLDGTSSAGKPNTYNPLGGGGQITQGNGGSTTEWIWRQWTGDPAEDALPLYAISEALIVGGADPFAPTVNAGSDMLTWSDKSVTMTPYVENKLAPDLEYAWVAETTDANVDIVLSPNSGDPLTSSDLTPIVTITKNDIGILPVTVKVTLTVNNVGFTNYVSDFMLIDVYDDACAVANAISPVSYDTGDVNKDCSVDLKDFSDMAAAWFKSYELTAPEPK